MLHIGPTFLLGEDSGETACRYNIGGLANLIWCTCVYSYFTLPPLTDQPGHLCDLTNCPLYFPNMSMRTTSDARFAPAPGTRQARRLALGPKLDMREWPGTDPRLTRLDRHLVYFEDLRKIAFDRYRRCARQSRDMSKTPEFRARAMAKRKCIFKTLFQIAEMKVKMTRRRKRLIRELRIVFH